MTVSASPGAATAAALLLVLASFALQPAGAQPTGARPTGTPPKTQILGYVENAVITGKNIKLPARLDTGARTTSLGVETYRLFRRGGRRWVRFTVEAGGETYEFEEPVVRMVRVLRAGAKAQRRPVVRLELCLGDHYRERVQVNLTDRSDMTYKLLIGRRFLGNRIAVLSSRRFTTEPDCSPKD